MQPVTLPDPEPHPRNFSRGPEITSSDINKLISNSERNNYNIQLSNLFKIIILTFFLLIIILIASNI